MPMLRIHLLLLVALFTLGPGCAPPQPTGPDAEAAALGLPPLSRPDYTTQGVRIATLNTHFLFDGLGNEGQATFEHRGDPAKARRHREAIARVVRSLDADVLLLQEVENESVLRALADSSLRGMGYAAYFVEGKDTYTGQDVAMLARIPIDKIGRTDAKEPLPDGALYGVSKNLYARTTLSGKPVTLVGLHFLAFPTDASRKAQREVQAEVIRKFIVAEMREGREVLVAGDFNDFDGAHPDAGGALPITNVLARIKQAGRGSADDLVCAASQAPAEERYTSYADRNRDDFADPEERSAIDHILLSPGLAAGLLEVDYVHTYPLGSYSDHHPIVVTLRR